MAPRRERSAVTECNLCETTAVRKDLALNLQIVLFVYIIAMFSVIVRALSNSRLGKTHHGP